jgi:hypothetical protein
MVTQQAHNLSIGGSIPLFVNFRAVASCYSLWFYISFFGVWLQTVLKRFYYKKLKLVKNCVEGEIYFKD